MKAVTGILVAIASLEAALVLLWISLFALAVGTPHQHWYVELPTAFLAPPIGACVVATLTQRTPPVWRFAALYLTFLLLVGNFCGFLLYALMSGGGV